MSDTPDVTPYEATYAGRTITKTGKTVYRFRDERDGDLYIFAKSPVKGATIGAVYQMHEKAGGGSVLVAGTYAPRWVRSLPWSDPDVIRWRAEDDLVEAERSRQSAIRKAGDPFKELEAVLTEASLGMTRAQRRALLLRLSEVVWSA